MSLSATPAALSAATVSPPPATAISFPAPVSSAALRAIAIVAVSNGLEIHFDPASAQRAKGIVIDWVSTVQGEGLSLKFPGAQEIKSLTVRELQQRLAAGDITLIDVRPASGRAQAAPLAQARVLEEEGYDALAALPKDTALAFICHHGVSSRGVAERFAAHGFSNVHNVEGGMDTWSREIDASVPRY